MFKVTKKTKKEHQNNVSNIFKINSTDTRATSAAPIVNFEHISHFVQLFYSAVEFQQINASWASETIVSDKKNYFQ